METDKKYRHCTVNGNKGLFHGWVDNGRVVLNGVGQFEGVVSDTAGLVEFEDGSVGKFNPMHIKFTDDLVKSEYLLGAQDVPNNISGKGKSAQWKLYQEGNDNHARASCSHCGYRQFVSTSLPILSNICPGCGSLMKKGEYNDGKSNDK